MYEILDVRKRAFVVITPAIIIFAVGGTCTAFETAQI